MALHLKILPLVLALTVISPVMAQPQSQPTPGERALQATIADQINALVTAHAQTSAAQDEIAKLQKQLDESKKTPAPPDQHEP